MTVAASLLAAMSCSGNEPSPEPTPSDTRSLTVQESVEIAHTGGEFTVEVKSNFTFDAQPQTDWIRFDRIEDELIELLQTEEDPTFSIYADETVPIREVVAVMNIAKRNHYKVIMATSPE